MINFGIVIPTYKRPDGNTPQLIKRALSSVNNQTYQNFKIFLIGDKYEDESEFLSFGSDISDEKIIKVNLENAYEREKYWHDKNILWNCGGVTASNFGIDMALKENFKYICRLDHDDWWEINHLSNFNQAIELCDPKFICSKSSYLNNFRGIPVVTSEHKFVPFLPTPARLINSSTCVEMESIPLRQRNVYETEGKVYPSDADLWKRMNDFIKQKKFNSILVNEKTCNHQEEGYTKKIK